MRLERETPRADDSPVAVCDTLRACAPALEAATARDPVHRLGESARASLVEHFLGLPLPDRRLRFGVSLADETLVSYVAGIDFDRDAMFGVYDEHLRLVGVAHVAFTGDTAELGLSVLPPHRRRGMGSTLFKRGAEHARNRSVSQLYMHCIAENAAIMHIAHRCGMAIVIDSGDADAHVTLPPASAASITGEFFTDRLALYDYALKSQVAVWHVVNATLEAPRPRDARTADKEADQLA